MNSAKNLTPIIRPAREIEAQALTDIAARSKAYWPYDKDYLELARQVTLVTPEDIRDWPFIVAELKGRIVGFAGVCKVRGEDMLDHLWIEPEFIGGGIGRVLFSHACEAARALGWKSFTIAADPYAEKFYLKKGACRIGQRESKVRPGFFLPLLEFHL